MSYHYKDLFSFIWQYMRLQPWRFFFIFLLSLVWSVDSVVWPYLLGLIIDTFTHFDTNRFSIVAFFVKKIVKFSNKHGEARSTLAGKIVDSFTNNFAVNMFYRFQFEKHRISASQALEKETNYRAHF